MKLLFVFYDGECGLCSSVRTRLAEMRQKIPLVFLPYQDPRVLELFPALPDLDPDRQIVVLSDTGKIYRGAESWILILWALRDFRGWVPALAHPMARPLAKKVVQWVAQNRLRFSGLLRLRPAALP